MVTFNDFRLLTQKSLSYFSMFIKTENISNNIVSDLSELEKARYGFYFYALEEITGISDFSDIVCMITDTDFNSKFYQKPYKDYGIDAVHVSEEDHQIKLFNFKYRKDYKQESVQKENELVVSSKYLDMIQSQKYENTEGIVKDRIEEVCKTFYDTKESWNIELYYVTNESNSINESPIVYNFGESISLKTHCYSLDEISNWFMTTHEEINAKLILENTAIMSYKESSLSSNVSYILRISLSDLLRITCDNKGYRMDADSFTKDNAINIKIDYNVLAENVRGLVIRSKFNKNIENTLDTNASKFFMYNNGVTIVANNIEGSEFSNKKRTNIIINGLQVINGGQTLRTIHNYNSTKKMSAYDNLVDAEILVRIFKVSDPNEYNKIAEFTNSQNSISQMDLKSITSEQKALEQYLAEYKIFYIRKRGDIGLKNLESFDYEISLERLGQILYAIKGDPDKATNKKRNIFDTEYERLFTNNKDLLSIETVNYIKDFHELRTEYRLLKGVQASIQISLYLIYLKCHCSLNSKEVVIKFNDYMTSEFKDESGSIINRQLINPKFKESIDKLYNIQCQ